MSELVRHRGPDSGGFYEGPGVGLLSAEIEVQETHCVSGELLGIRKIRTRPFDPRIRKGSASVRPFRTHC